MIQFESHVRVGYEFVLNPVARHPNKFVVFNKLIFFFFVLLVVQFSLILSGDLRVEARAEAEHLKLILKNYNKLRSRLNPILNYHKSN